MTTTINNHLTLIDQVGGIEKAKAIVEGAPRFIRESGVPEAILDAEYHALRGDNA